MSGFAGIVNLDGAPVDRELLWKLTRSIAYRGPDRQEIRIEGQAGFGHTMLRTTWAAEREFQPCTLDGHTWITADCRIDGRDELIGALEAKGRLGARSATDPELILHAWAVWGTDCPQHLLGDFSFAIWDGRSQRLFCARDHMGVKLFYYARKGNCLVFGNTLNSLRLHPAVSDSLNELAIADFLLFGHNQDPATSTFADIQRLPPAHTMQWQGGELRIDRYWMLPIDPPLRLARSEEYVEQFLDLLRTVVGDRLRTDRVGILMSGGLDSTGMAAIAKELARESPVELSAHTLVFDRLIPDRERYYAGVAAAHLRIPIHYYAGDDYGFFGGALGGATYAEPGFVTDFGAPGANAELAGIAAGARVTLFGEGPDNALHYDWKPYLRYELSRGHLGQVLRDVAGFPALFGHLPLWKRWSRAKPTRERPPEVDPIAPWLSQEFADRMKLRERYAWSEQSGSAQGFHPVRPGSYSSLFISLWQWIFEWHDSGVTGLPLEVRNPFIDIRMMRYLMSVPVVPWCRDKYLLRRAFARYLPAEIVGRPKCSLAGFPSYERYKEIGLPADLPIRWAEGYIDTERLETTPIDGQALLGMKLRSVALAFFLRDLGRTCIIRGT